MKSFKRLVMGLAAAGAAAVAATPASAVIVTSIQIKTVQATFLQVAELQAYASNLAGNQAPTLGTATATSVYAGSTATANKANDGIVTGAFPNIYHGNASDGSDVLTLTFSAPLDLVQLTIYGRSDGGTVTTSRNYYTYTLFNGAATVGSGTLDARGTTGNMDYVAGVPFAAAIPEPAAWGMMILGMGAVGVALRRRVRISESRFDDRIARMTAGEIA